MTRRRPLNFAVQGRLPGLKPKNKKIGPAASDQDASGFSDTRQLYGAFIDFPAEFGYADTRSYVSGRNENGWIPGKS